MARDKARPKIRWRLWLAVLAWSAISVSTAMALHRAYRFVLTDPQFVLSGEQRGALSLEGVKYASRWKLMRVFHGDYGRSVFAMPLAERRRRLLGVDWVEDASVGRIWPNRIVVRISERRPVAFVSLPFHGGSNSPARFLLIDSQGVLLDPPPKAQFAFPVLTGTTEDQTDAERRIRVWAMLRLLEDLGPSAQNVSEVNASVPDDLTMVAQVEGRLLEFRLGHGNYARRFQNFLVHYPEIHKRTPGVRSFDLRLDDRITAKEPQGRS